MSNSYFDFKQFRIEQDRCGMKVSTDACIQGAWTPVLPAVNKVLDIGCGTGLLGLMLAQRVSTIAIDAIELDATAAQQALQNIHAAPWSERMKVQQADACTFTPPLLYDLVICNPPFFNDSLRSKDRQRNHARHSDTLSQEQLLDAIDRCLILNGYASVLLPVAEHQKWEVLTARNGWHLFQRLDIQPYAHSAVNRIVSLIARTATNPALKETLIIYERPGVYTEAFSTLLRPFYLKLS